MIRPRPAILRHLALVSLLVLFGQAAPAQSLTETRARLQAALQSSLSRSLINGALRHIDLTDGKITLYYPEEMHEKIVQIGDTYVMCATLISTEGQEAPVDYYLSQTNGRYVVIRTEIDNRAPLKALIDAGKATRLE